MTKYLIVNNYLQNTGINSNNYFPQSYYSNQFPTYNQFTEAKDYYNNNFLQIPNLNSSNVTFKNIVEEMLRNFWQEQSKMIDQFYKKVDEARNDRDIAIKEALLLKEKINVINDLKQGQEMIKDRIGFYPFNNDYNKTLEDIFDKKVEESYRGNPYEDENRYNTQKYNQNQPQTKKVNYHNHNQINESHSDQQNQPYITSNNNTINIKNHQSNLKDKNNFHDYKSTNINVLEFRSKYEDLRQSMLFSNRTNDIFSGRNENNFDASMENFTKYVKIDPKLDLNVDDTQFFESWRESDANNKNFVSEPLLAYHNKLENNNNNVSDKIIPMNKQSSKNAQNGNNKIDIILKEQAQSLNQLANLKIQKGEKKNFFITEQQQNNNLSVVTTSMVNTNDPIIQTAKENDELKQINIILIPDTKVLNIKETQQKSNPTNVKDNKRIQSAYLPKNQTITSQESINGLEQSLPIFAKKDDYLITDNKNNNQFEEDIEDLTQNYSKSKENEYYLQVSKEGISKNQLNKRENSAKPNPINMTSNINKCRINFPNTKSKSNSNHNIKIVSDKVKQNNNNDKSNSNLDEENPYEKNPFGESPELDNDENQVDFKEFNEMQEIDKLNSKACFFENYKIEKPKVLNSHVIQDDLKKVNNRQIFSHNDALEMFKNNLSSDSNNNFNNSSNFQPNDDNQDNVENFDVVEVYSNSNSKTYLQYVYL